MLTCPDLRTAVLFKLEAIDLADDGDSITYYRRDMSILDRVLPKPGIAVNNIINEFTKEEIEDIYPSLSQMLISLLVEDLELMGYLKITDGKATVTEKGETKLKDFKMSLSAEEKEALRM
jgi:ribosomal protein S19E (S16A)